MNTNLDKIALDLYGKIQTRFSDIKIGDENATVLSKKQDVPKARFFEFEYLDGGKKIGTITITLDEDDGVVVQTSGELANKQHEGAFRFIRGLRSFAKDRLLNFDVQNIGKDNLDKRDYEFQSKKKEQPVMQQPMKQPAPKPKMAPKSSMMENKMYGTTRMSYQDLGEAKLIVKHSQPVNLDLAAGRTMHIEGIWVENTDGERFRYPYKHLNGARALAEHIKAGGNPYDVIGQHICSLSEELTQLRKFKSYVGRNETLSEAMDDINTCVNDRIEAVKKEVHSLQRPAYYKQFAESFQANESQEIPEAILNDWIDRLTIRTFNEELKTAFPYIYRLVGENISVKELSPEDMLSELRSEEKDENGNVVRWKEEGEWKKVSGKGKDGRGKVTNMSDKARRETEKLNKKDESLDPLGRFESFMDRIVSEDGEEEQGENSLFSSNAELQAQSLAKLKELIATGLKPGVDGVNATLSLKGIIDSPTFTDDYLEGLTDEDDVGTAIKLYLQDLATGKISEPDSPKAKDVAQTIIATKALNSAGDTPVGGEEVPPGGPEGAPPGAPPPDAAAAGAPPPDAAAAGAPPPPGAPPPDAAAAGAPPPPGAPPVAESMGGSHPKARLIRAIHTAKKHGAKLDTTLDFGHKEMTLHDCIEECGMSPDDFGFDHNNQEDGVHQMLKSISGFWNKEAKNFTIGGTRAKTKVVKDFKNGEFSNATEEELQHVLRMIDKMDPSDSGHNELGHIKHLAGMHDQVADEDMMDPQAMMKGMMGQMGGMKMPQGGGNSITVNGKPSTQAEFDAFTKQHSVTPGQMPGGQKLTPGQMPGGMKTPQIGGNPQDMVNNMMKGMNESTELTAMLKIAGLR